MSRNRRLSKKIPRTYRKLFRAIASTFRQQKTWLLRTLLVMKQPRKSTNSGFVLPTVAMVSLVVVLLTVAILFRSFERSKNASNVRVNEAVLSSAMPAIDRAKAKIDELFKDPRLPRSTPSDFSLGQVLEGDREKFTFGDETPLKVVSEFNGKAGIQADEEALTSAWKYPVDTNNDGLFDSYTLYGIYYRTPQSNRSRGAVEARTRPMDDGARGAQCESEVATSANLVGTQGWYKIGNKLKRSLFVYTATVPITEQNLVGIPAAERKKYKPINKNANTSFATLEYQQDRERIPLNNNAVLYENDLEIAPGAGINLNGRIFTNGNLLTRQPFDPIRFYLVSSDKSCYFNEENSKIVVAGNVIKSRVNESAANEPKGDVQVDLFSLPYSGGKDKISNDNSTVPKDVFGSLAAYNDEAYVRRIERLVEATIANYPNRNQLPTEVQEEIRRDEADARTFQEARERQLKIYFRKRTRRVPYAEVPVGGDALGTYKTGNPLQGNGDSLRPIDAWVFPFSPNDGTTAAGFANIGINTKGDKVSLPATDPDEQAKLNEEKLIGDRILVGNNMPQLWYDKGKKRFVSSPDDGQVIKGKKWNSGDKERKRFSQAYQLDDLGITERNGFWELSAAQQPQGVLDVVGGTRVITGAGIYLPASVNEGAGSGVLASLGTTGLSPVWPDSMAMIPPGSRSTQELAGYGINNPDTPYLRMRASVVYHYKEDTYDPKANRDTQKPIACVSSFYDPTNETTARNRDGLPNVSLRNATTPNRNLTGLPLVAVGAGGNSHNGVVYSAAGITPAAITTYRKALDNQAELKYPNGKLVNEALNKAMKKIANNGALTLEEQSAIDSAICALKIFDGSIGSPTDAVIPHGAIMETTFLDARQIKAIDKPGANNTTKYNLDVEFRQPLEIRTTVLDMDLMRRKAFKGDFLIPNSGIIYASRDDAEPDKSNPNSADVSATDFQLDPNRRPNAIMLINGSDLSRNDTYKPEEKGLILASNTPVYVKAQKITGQEVGFFNRHTQEEFSDIKLKEKQQWGEDFYKRKTLNPQFACRKGQFKTCTTGETWRPASIIADGITVLSADFREGYRNEGDYELRDNLGYATLGYSYPGGSTETDLQIDFNRDGNIDNTTTISAGNVPAVVAARINGFWDNNFVTSFPWKDAKADNEYGFPELFAGGELKSSYFNNFVTPIQRRGDFNEYVMEICRKSTVAACTPNDWVVGYDGNKNVKARELKPNDTTYTVDKLGAGTTARFPIDTQDWRYPRRIAFLRDENNKLVLAGGLPIPLGVKGDNVTKLSDIGSDKDNSGQINYYPYADHTVDGKQYKAFASGNRPRRHRNALWFKTNNAGVENYGRNYPLWIQNPTLFATSRSQLAEDQPLLVPVLQIQYPFRSPADNTTTLTENKDVFNHDNKWIQQATDTETNLIFAQGDTPARPTESNGGLENFVRYLEKWRNTRHIAQGAFIQFKRSSYATAPWWVFEEAHSNANNGFSSTPTTFGYPQGYRTAVTNVGNLGRSPFYAAPTRFWGYDVALLSQLPDLFSQRFASPTTNAPNEYFREVSRDDRWVKPLLCAAQQPTTQDKNNLTSGYDSAPTNRYGTNHRYALNEDQRPSDCDKI